MKRHLVTFAILLLLGIFTCAAVTLLLASIKPPDPLPATLTTPLAVAEDATPTRLPTSTVTDTPEPTSTVTVTPTPTLTASPTPKPAAAFSVRFHPDHALYAGDQVSWEVIAPPEVDLSGQTVTVWLNGERAQPFGPLEFRPFGIAGRMQATFTWAWDTTDLESGLYILTYNIDPGGNQWEERVFLHPQELLRSPEPDAHWAITESDCCLVYYITQTEAERDLDLLLEQMDQVAQEATEKLGVELEEAVTVTLLPRVMGHGGFAGDGIHISYLDRNYAGSDFEMVLHHEMIHILDSRLGSGLPSTILAEGLAVYLSGGHFKQEEILPRAAALLQLPGIPGERERGWYLDLAELAADFYSAQHEISYLQAAALVQVMVDTWGWDAFSDFYWDVQPDPNGSQVSALETALQEHFGLSLSALEELFLDELLRQDVTPEHIEDVRLTVAFYDSVRRYQEQMDPSAYFLTAWLMDLKEMQKRGIVADYLRRPMATVNLVMEELLVDANQYLVSGEYVAAEQALEILAKALDVQEDGTSPQDEVIEVKAE